MYVTSFVVPKTVGLFSGVSTHGRVIGGGTSDPHNHWWYAQRPALVAKLVRSVSLQCPQLPVDHTGEPASGQGRSWAFFQPRLKGLSGRGDERDQFSRHVYSRSFFRPGSLDRRYYRPLAIRQTNKYSNGAVGPVRTWEVTHAALTHP